MFIVISLTDLVLDPRRVIDLGTLSPDEIARRVRESFRFLGDNVEVAVEHDAVKIFLKHLALSAEEEATIFTTKGINFGKAGKYTQAIDCFQRALEVLPTKTAARRNLAMSLLESGKAAAAENHLIETLRLDPHDAESYILLGNIFVRKKNDVETALRMFERAVELRGDDVVALTNLGGLLGQMGEVERAEELFQKAIALNAAYPNPYYGWALLCLQQARSETALLVLKQMFENTPADDKRNKSFLEMARALFLDANRKVAEKSLPLLREFLDHRKKELDDAAGVRIALIEDESITNGKATAQMAWRYQADHHVVRYQKSTSVVVPHLVAHELQHIAMEIEARAAGRNMSFATSGDVTDRARHGASAFLDRMRGHGMSPKEADEFLGKMVKGMLNQLYNAPLDMIIEQTLFDHYEILRPSQFVSLTEAQLDCLPVLVNPEIKKSTPSAIFKANLTMNASLALHADHLYAGITSFAEPYRRSEVYPIAQKLFGAWQEMMKTFKPGDEYELVNTFAKILNLENWFKLIPENGGVEESGGVTNADLLEAKQQSTVMYLLGALQRFSKMEDEDVFAVASEIALLGQHGLDYSNADAKYSLRSIPGGETFSGLQLMCMMFVGLKLHNPGLDTGMGFDKEFDTARKLFDSGRP